MHTRRGSRRPSLALVAALALLYGCPPPNCPSPVAKQITISKYVTTAFTQDQVNASGQQAASVMQTNHGGSDMICCVQFTQNGALGTFDTGTGTIDTQAQLDAVLALPGWVKVVSVLSYCDKFNPSVGGCGPINGTTFVVEPYGADIEGIIWDHEYGHNAGLQHSTDSVNFMFPTLSTATTHKTSDQCTSVTNK